MHEKQKTSSLFPKWDDHNAKQDWKTTRTKNKATLNMKLTVVKTTKLYKELTPGKSTTSVALNFSVFKLLNA